MLKIVKTISWILVIFISGFIFSFYINNHLSEDRAIKNSLVKATPQTTTQPGELATSFSDAVDKADPSVVEIYTAKDKPAPLYYNPQTDRYVSPQNKSDRSNIGSGVIIDDDGHIVTSYHVIDGADSILVSFNGDKALSAEVVGVDPETDLAVIKIKTELDIKPIIFADSSKIKNGDIVFAIGNPFGVGKTVTMGIVSATGRNDLGISVFESFIQTDAAINPGNSGGALINAKGELVGINSAIVSRNGGSQGIGFAAPSNQVIKVIKSLIGSGKVTRGWLGVSIQTVYKKEDDRQVTEVIGLFPDGPAEVSGLLPGDLLLTINGKAVGDASNAQDVISSYGPGEKITIEAERDGKKITFNSSIGSRPRVEK